MSADISRNESGEFVRDDTALRDALIELIDVMAAAHAWSYPIVERLASLRLQVSEIDLPKGASDGDD